jgi:hypothetical protein
LGINILTLSGRLPEDKKEKKIFLYFCCSLITDIVKTRSPEQKRSLVANGLMLPFGNTRPLENKNFKKVNFFSLIKMHFFVVF